MGQAEATVDPKFNQLENDFKEQYTKVKKLTNFVHNYQSSIKELGTSQRGMAQMIFEQYDQSDEMYPTAIKLSETVIPQCNTIRENLEQYFNDNFQQPLSMYLAQYKVIEERIAERNTRLVDMDRYNMDLKALLAKPDTDPTKIQMAKEKVEAKSQQYQSLNDELIRDIPSLLNDKSRFFDALFAVLIIGQIGFLGETAQSIEGLEDGFKDINRAGVISWPFVVTPSSISAHKSSVTLPDTPEPIPDGGAGFQPLNATSDLPKTNAQQSEPTPKPQASQPLARAQALYPFQGQDHTELTFQYNDIIVVYRQGGEWWEGELNGRRGLFPSNYVKMI